MTDPTPPDAAGSGRSPRTWTLVASAVLTVAVVAAGGAIALFGDNSDDTQPPAAATATAPADDTDPTGTAAPGEPLTAAPATEWTAVDGLFTPVSEQAGPTDVDDAGVPSGFTQTAEGALFAAAQIALRTGAAYSPEARTAVATTCVTGEDAATFAATVTEAEQISPAEAAIVTAFDYHAYSGDEALIELVMDAGVEDLYAGFLITVTWTGTDWAVQAPANGDWNTAVRPIRDLSVFIAWGP